MKILHTENSCGWGGQEIRILTEAAGMIARGHDVTLACPPQARIYTAAAQYGVPVVALPITKKRPGGIAALRAFLQRHHVDVINTHSSTDSWLTALACATLKHPPPIVRTRHISAPIPDNLPTRWLYRQATAFTVTTGEKLREQLIRDNGLRPERVVSIPTGIDVGRYAPASGDKAALRQQLGLPVAAPVVGILATLRSWKGHAHLLEAFARHLPVDCHLLVVGDGPQRGNLEAQAGQLGIAGRVTFAGNQSDVVPWLQVMDVFALPSYANEGVPQALMQAMSTALPCVTTTVGAINELAREGETALVVPPQQPALLGEALARLLADADLRQRLGEAARAHVVAGFARERMVERMEAVFAAAVRGDAALR